MKNNRGFTLIELLVVIAVIGILASVVLASLNSARGKARDAARQAGLVETQKALELYYDSYGRYPDINPSCPYPSWSYSHVCADYIPGLLTTGLLSKLPTSSGGAFMYSTRASDNYQSYKLSAYPAEHTPVPATSRWAHCPASCVTAEPSSWCASHQTDYVGWFSVSNGVARCGY